MPDECVLHIIWRCDRHGKDDQQATLAEFRAAYNELDCEGLNDPPTREERERLDKVDFPRPERPPIGPLKRRPPE